MSNTINNQNTSNAAGNISAGMNNFGNFNNLNLGSNTVSSENIDQFNSDMKYDSDNVENNKSNDNDSKVDKEDKKEDKTEDKEVEKEKPKKKDDNKIKDKKEDKKEDKHNDQDHKSEATPLQNTLDIKINPAETRTQQVSGTTKSSGIHNAITDISKYATDLKVNNKNSITAKLGDNMPLALRGVEVTIKKIGNGGYDLSFSGFENQQQKDMAESLIGMNMKEIIEQTKNGAGIQITSVSVGGTKIEANVKEETPENKDRQKDEDERGGKEHQDRRQGNQEG